jgi:hypothetical protein
MPSITGFLEFNNSRMKPSRKFGNSFRITFIPTPWHGRMDDYLELLPWPDSAISGPRRRSSRWFFHLSFDVAKAKTLIDKIASNQNGKLKGSQLTPRVCIKLAVSIC